jgi:hypothetical protein
MPTGATGRNDPCSCGSGKKYKKCCLERDLANVPKVVEPHEDLDPPDLPRCAGHGHEHLRAGVLHVPLDLTAAEAREYIQRLDRWSHDAHDALDEGRLEEAERLADRLAAEYPDQVDGYEVRAMVRLQQRRWAEAADGFEQAVATAMRHREDYDEEFIEKLRRDGEYARTHAHGHDGNPTSPSCESHVHRHES